MIISENITSRTLEMNTGTSSITFKYFKSNNLGPRLLYSIFQFIITKIRLNKRIKITLDFSDKEIAKFRKNPQDYLHISLLIIYYNDEKIIENISNIEKIKERLYLFFENQNNYYSSNLFQEIGQDNVTKTSSRKKDNKIFSQNSKNKKVEGFNFITGSFDHNDEENINNPVFLYSSNFVKVASNMQLWIERLFKFNNIDLDPSGFHKTGLKQISNLIYELYQNTDDWAKATYNFEESYKDNYRGVNLNLLLEPRLKLITGQGHDEIGTYLNDLYKRPKDKIQIEYNQQKELFEKDYKLALLEISVLDFGPGMARRWLSRDYNEFNLDTEKEAVKKCFIKNFTTDSSGKNALRGQGLANVLEIIKDIGFIKIHSGNVIMHRNFIIAPLQKEMLANPEEIQFTYTPSVGKVEGTLITILYPILYSI